jgi:arsenite-transporting ATPase
VLSLFGYRMDAVVVNGMLPAEVEDPFFDDERAAQEAAVEEVRGMQLPLRVVAAGLDRAPIVGQEALTRFARSLYGEDSALLPGEEGFVGDHTIERQSGQYVVQISLPYARREELRLEDVDEGIVVHLNGRRCIISLPSDVLYTEATSWVYEENVLRVVLDR